MIPIFNWKTRKNVWIRAFLDSGSNMTAISKNCLEKCGLKEGSPENIFLSTFQTKVKRKLVSKTSFNIYKDSCNDPGNLSIQAYVMDQVLSPIKSYPISKEQQQYFLKHDITLADSEAIGGKKLVVDMLIGQEYIHHFYEGEHKFIPGGLLYYKIMGGQTYFGGTHR